MSTPRKRGSGCSTPSSLGKRIADSDCGFSSVNSREIFSSRFPGVTVSSLKESKLKQFLVRERYVLSKSVAIEYMRETCKEFIVTCAITQLGGEKLLYFSSFDLLRYPLLLLQDLPECPMISTLDCTLESELDDIASQDPPKLMHEKTLTYSATIGANKYNTQGPVEFVVKSGKQIIFVNKVKDAFAWQNLENTPAVWQLLAELYAAITMNDVGNNTVYGALSSVTHFTFFHVILDEGILQVSASDELAFIPQRFGSGKWLGCPTSGLVISYLLEILRLAYKDPVDLEPENLVAAVKASQKKCCAAVEVFINTLVTDVEKDARLAEKDAQIEKLTKELEATRAQLNN